MIDKDGLAKDIYFILSSETIGIKNEINNIKL